MRAHFSLTTLSVAVTALIAACASAPSSSPRDGTGAATTSPSSSPSPTTTSPATTGRAPTPASSSAPAAAAAPAQAASVPGKPDAQMQQVLNELSALGARPLHTLSVEQARKSPTPADAVKQVLQRQGKSTEPMPVAKVTDVTIQGVGGQIPARIYWPQGMTQASPPMPVVLYIHGGGWVIADLDTYDASARALANAANAIVVSTHYRQAPEHQFPAAHEDAWAAYQGVLLNAQRLGGDPKRIAVAGESAGGNMAAAIALRARDQKVQAPVHQLLVYPVADAAVGSPSEQQFEKASPLATPDLPWFYSKYLGDKATDASPGFSLRDADVRGVAPATVILAEIDPLRSEGQAYAERLRAAGVPVRVKNFDGVTHEFFGMGAVVDKAKEAVQFAAEGLQQGWQAGAAPAAPVPSTQGATPQMPNPQTTPRVPSPVPTPGTR